MWVWICVCVLCVFIYDDSYQLETEDWPLPLQNASYTHEWGYCTSSWLHLGSGPQLLCTPRHFLNQVSVSSVASDSITKSFMPNEACTPPHKPSNDLIQKPARVRYPLLIWISGSEILEHHNLIHKQKTPKIVNAFSWIFSFILEWPFPRDML